MTDVIQEYFEKQQAKGRRGGLNLPAMARKAGKFMSCIVADPGHVFVSQDVVALEPSITAEMSQDPMYLYATLTGIGQRPRYEGNVLMIDDIYLMSASQFPPTRDKLKDMVDNHRMIKVDNPKSKGVDDKFMLVRDDSGQGFAEWWLENNELVKDYTKKTVRNFAKVACLGIGYGMGARKFRTTAEENGSIITYQEAKGTIEAYWELFKGLKALRDSLSWEIKKHGFVTNPFGYRCTPEAHKAMNSFIQSSASGVLDVYCLKLFSVCPYAKFVALIHDEVIFSIPEDLQERLKSDSENVVKSLNDDLGWSVPIRFGTKVATTFGGMK
jgi:DNA polymerase I-like protein with 3'-5' exonuclease and polymerase domains